MDVIILAGGRSTDDPMSELAHGQPKSMLEIAGKPMVQWVLDAVNKAPSINTIALIGIENTEHLQSIKPMKVLPDLGSLMENIQQGARIFLEMHPEETHVMSISADIPAITGDIVEAMVREYSEFNYDIYYSVVERQVMEKRFPGSKRTYMKVKDGEYCGGDLNCYSKRAALNPEGLWKELIKSRKNPLKQAALIGLDTLGLLLIKQLTLDQAAFRVCRRMGITGKALRVPFAEIGMDVDKPFQFEIVQADLLR
jgi:GTP:adenosylcobinamide-phosphate guanylyltransferase